ARAAPVLVTSPPKRMRTSVIAMVVSASPDLSRGTGLCPPSVGPGGGRSLRRLRLRKEVLPRLGRAVLVGTTVDGGQGPSPVEVRRRRGGRPLERGRIPGIHGCLRSCEQGPEEVDYEGDLGKAETHGADGDDDVPMLLVLEELVLHRVVDAPHLAAHPDDVHRKEREVEEDEGAPEVQMPEGHVRHPAEHLGEPVVDGREGAEDGAPE